MTQGPFVFSQVLGGLRSVRKEEEDTDGENDGGNTFDQEENLVLRNGSAGDGSDWEDEWMDVVCDQEMR